MQLLPLWKKQFTYLLKKSQAQFSCITFISLESQETSGDAASSVQKDMYDWEYVDIALVAVQAFTVHLFTSIIFQSLDCYQVYTIKDKRWVLCEMNDLGTCQVPNLSSLPSKTAYKIVSSILQFFLRRTDRMRMFLTSKVCLCLFKPIVFYVVSCTVLSTWPKC